MNEKWYKLINIAKPPFLSPSLSLTSSVIQFVQLGGLQILELYLEVPEQLLSLGVGFYLGLGSGNPNAHEARHGDHCQIRMDVIACPLTPCRCRDKHKAPRYARFLLPVGIEGQPMKMSSG